MKNLVLIAEKQDGHFWGTAEKKSGFMATGQGDTLLELIQNVKDSMTDYQEHEGQTDKFWKSLDIEHVKFDIKYDLEAFFERFNYLNLSKIAERVGINRSLLNQYSTGIKCPSLEQAKKIEDTIHDLAKEMAEVRLVA